MFKRLYLMCGAPACGKTSYIQTNAPRGTSAHISRDKVREVFLSDDESYFSAEKKVFDEYIDQIKSAIFSPWVESIYADATQISEKSRLKVLHSLGLALAGVDVYVIDFETTLEDCLERNRERVGRARVPESAIRNIYNAYTDPSKDKFEYKRIIKV